MSLIDLKKLNAEVDELIRKQDEEVKAMKEAVYIAQEDTFKYFISKMKSFREIVEGFNEPIRVFTGCFDNGYGCRRAHDVIFDAKGRSYGITVTYMNTLGDTMLDFTISYESDYKYIIQHSGHKGIVDSISKWYKENEAEFERRLEEELADIIKKKAERANARYESARRELDETK